VEGKSTRARSVPDGDPDGVWQGGLAARGWRRREGSLPRGVGTPPGRTQGKPRRCVPAGRLGNRCRGTPSVALAAWGHGEYPRRCRRPSGAAIRAAREGLAGDRGHAWGRMPLFFFHRPPRGLPSADPDLGLVDCAHATDGGRSNAATPTCRVFRAGAQSTKPGSLKRSFPLAAARRDLAPRARFQRAS